MLNSATPESIDPMAHQGMIGDIAKRYRGRGLEWEDLMQEGNLGLLTGLKKHEPEKGTVSTYAKHWVKCAILEAIYAQARPSRVPAYLRKRIRRGASPNDPGLKPRRRDCLESAIRVLGMARVAEEVFPLAETVERARDQPSRDFAAEVALKLDRLDQRERKIIGMRFGIDGDNALSLSKIGLAIGLTKERIRQIEQRALAKLAEHLRES